MWFLFVNGELCTLSEQMRSIKLNLSKQPVTGWDAAVILVESYFSSKLKADQLLEQLPNEFTGERRAICQSLFLGALRHGHCVDAALKPLVKKSPRSIVKAVLFVAGYEMSEAEEVKLPKIVHHAVEQSKKIVAKSELGFLNAVLRKLPHSLQQVSCSENLGAKFSHPQWLIDHWIKEFGAETTEKLLRWNQQTPKTYLKVYKTTGELSETLVPTKWESFHKAADGVSWKHDILPLLNQGNAYAKDPSTRIATELLAPQAGETVLDLCAAPGGKAFDMAYAMSQRGTIIAVDLPGKRIQRLRENLSTLKSDSLLIKVIEKDLLELSHSDFEKQKLPVLFDAVMLDAPCSNTGVIQRRTDVKWRLRQSDIKNCVKLQKKLITAAAQFVKPGGRLAYSTCSIERSENLGVIDAFLKSPAGQEFTLKDSQLSYPWQSGHDGAGVSILVRRG